MKPKHIHLIGICGTAMASLAGMLQQRGHRVSGSDAAAYPPMSEFLTSLNIPVAQPFSQQNLEPRPDLVIVGNAISRGNVELEYVLDQRIAYESMARVLHNEFLTGRERLVVAGTHGKTTTSSLLAWLFTEGQRAPSFLIGGIAENFGSSFTLGQGREFIIEGDEYDTAFFDKGPKFLHYFPDAVILTSVEFDHADIYKNLEEVKTAFKRLVNLVPRRGLLIAWDGHSNVDECVSRALCRVERYGFGERSEWRISGVDYANGGSRWKVWRTGTFWAEFESPLAGEYNVLNATAAAAMAANYGIPVDTIARALGSFRSVKRRLEVKAEVHGVTIIDDFAHHPTAISGTLQALRNRYPGRRLWAILEPRSNTLRRKVFEAELAESLAHADEVVLASVFKSDAIAESERLDIRNVVAKLNAAGTSARTLASADEIVTFIVPEVCAGDVVAILSNGGFGGIYDKLPAKLASRREVQTPA
ncbi:MAG TPA: UDP-N-acetylmuramate:L-alanyl-gamma-D-glutamyl-meso-diaminopimelate ligase [Candidatus Eisenbacteria bacterium]|nr:UDP-N-acetylmuramate:L-alanyl-gamma-D-glutamyl-meso-diaminopimelate ligase [Candidatus Eisenbacteria bacterium]